MDIDQFNELSFLLTKLSNASFLCGAFSIEESDLHNLEEHLQLGQNARDAEQEIINFFEKTHE